MNYAFYAKQIFYVVFTIGVLLIGTISCSCYKKGFNNETFYGTDISQAEERILLEQKTYHFGLDKFDISQVDMLSVYAHAKKIKSSPKIRVRIEGHTDERGSRGYNVALGERRAKAVANILLLKGVDMSQITIVSYGKEKPVVNGHNEAAWKENRRAVIVYEKNSF